MRPLDWVLMVVAALAAAFLVYFGQVLLTVEPPPSYEPDVQLRVLPDQAFLSLDENPTLVAQGDLLTRSGRDPVAPIRWTSVDTSVATVDATGQIRAKSPGVTQVVAEIGGLVDTVTVQVRIPEEPEPSQEGQEPELGPEESQTQNGAEALPLQQSEFSCSDSLLVLRGDLAVANARLDRTSVRRPQ